MKSRLLTGLTVIGLLGITSVSIGIFASYGVGSYLVEVFDTTQLAILYFVLIFLSAYVSEMGKILDIRYQYLGTFTMLLSYSLIVPAVLILTEIPYNSTVVLAGLAFYIVYVITVLIYGYKSNSVFSSWRVRAVFLGFSTIIMAAGGYFVEVVLILAVLSAALTMLLETLHVIGRTKRAAKPRHISDGARIYISLLGFPATISKAVYKVLKR